MKVTNVIEVGMSELSRGEWKRLFSDLTFLDGEQREVTCWRMLTDRDAVRFPRGVWSRLPDHVVYHDQRTCPPMPELQTTIELDSDDGVRSFTGQEKAVQAMLAEEQGLVIRPPGTGKTQIALEFCARAKTRTLVIVHTNDILAQWIEYIERAIPGCDVGVVKAQQDSIGHITIATVQTLNRRNLDKAWWRQFGAVILDEAHHAAALTFELVLNQCTARYRFGLTATKMRADGLEPLMESIIGPVIHEEKFKAPFAVFVKPLRSKFTYRYRGAFDWSRLLDKLEVDEARNRLIAESVDREVRAGNSVLVLSRRITHLRMISEACETYAEHGAALVGSWENIHGTRYHVSNDERNRIRREFREGKIRLVLATHLADESLDVPILNRVFLTFPGKHAGRLIQQVGRALREYPDKTDAVVYDVVDRRVGVLNRQWFQRQRFYRKCKFKVKGAKLWR